MPGFSISTSRFEVDRTSVETMAPEMEHHHGGADFVAPEKHPASSTINSSTERDAAKTPEEIEKQQHKQQLPEQPQAEERSMPPPGQQPQPITEK